MSPDKVVLRPWFRGMDCIPSNCSELYPVVRLHVLEQSSSIFKTDNAVAYQVTNESRALIVRSGLPGTSVAMAKTSMSVAPGMLPCAPRVLAMSVAALQAGSEADALMEVSLQLISTFARR